MRFGIIGVTLHVRQQDLLDVVPDGFAPHDDRQLGGQLHQTPARVALWQAQRVKVQNSKYR